MPSTEKLTVTVAYKNGGSLYTNIPASYADTLQLYVGLNARISLLLQLSSTEMEAFKKGEQVTLPELVIVKT